MPLGDPTTFQILRSTPIFHLPTLAFVQKTHSQFFPTPSGRNPFSHPAGIQTLESVIFLRISMDFVGFVVAYKTWYKDVCLKVLLMGVK